MIPAPPKVCPLVVGLLEVPLVPVGVEPGAFVVVPEVVPVPEIGFPFASVPPVGVAPEVPVGVEGLVPLLVPASVVLLDEFELKRPTPAEGVVMPPVVGVPVSPVPPPGPMPATGAPARG